jgi:hypothetical protein
MVSKDFTKADFDASTKPTVPTSRRIHVIEESNRKSIERY